MPRKQTKQVSTVNPMHKEFISKVMNSICTIEKLELSNLKNITKVFASDPEVKKDMLEDIMSEVTTTFNIDRDLTPKITCFDAKSPFDKKRVFNLPPYTENVVSRVVIVSGSHEIFYPALMDKLPIKQGIFVPQGSAFITSPSKGVFSYDNRNVYDSSLYPGTGVKRPGERRLIIIDYFGDNQEDVNKALTENTIKDSERLIKENVDTSNGGLISNLIKRFGFNNNEKVNDTVVPES